MRGNTRAGLRDVTQGSVGAEGQGERRIPPTPVSCLLHYVASCWPAAPESAGHIGVDGSTLPSAREVNSWPGGRWSRPVNQRPVPVFSFR